MNCQWVSVVVGGLVGIVAIEAIFAPIATIIEAWRRSKGE